MPGANGAGYDLGASVISSGYSMAFVAEVEHARIGRYGDAEERAFAVGAGVWGACGGNFHHAR